MGYAYHELLPVAVVMDNPGLDRHQLAEELSKVHFNWNDVSEDESWNYHDDNPEDGYGQGLKSVAERLGLGVSRRFRDYQVRCLEDGLTILGVPHIQRGYDLRRGKRDGKLDLSINYGVRLGPAKYSDGEMYFPLGWGAKDFGVGSTGQGESDERQYIVTRVDQFEGVDENRYKVKFEAVPVEAIHQKRKFKTLNEIYTEFPELCPEFLYDFDQSEGRFTCEWTDHMYSMFWKMRDGRYYLDEKSFDKMPASFLSSISLGHGFNFGYCDLVLTAEAIRHQAWRLLSRHGVNHLKRFLEDFPDSRIRYEQAVWDSHTSLSAKKDGKSVNELLRMRLGPHQP